MKILITGATGLIGSALSARLLKDQHTVVRLRRGGAHYQPGDAAWDPSTGTVDPAALDSVDAVVNLAGASIAGGRWTSARKAELRASRVEPTRALVSTLAKLPRPPQVLVSASAIGYYGDRGDETLAESSAPGDNFLAGICREWEAAAMEAERAGIRTVTPRTSIVLAKDGGALAKMITPFRLGVGGRLGSGKQWMSWITLEDAVEVFYGAIVNAQWRGAVNAASPHPVTNAEFTRVLARVLHRPAIFPAPAFALRLMLGEMAEALLLSSQRVSPQKLTELGFSFRQSQLEPALRAILS
ncbi:MAG: TIGR01777 family oxidoreductase [Candidatus Acidiferrales bacterium]